MPRLTTLRGQATGRHRRADRYGLVIQFADQFLAIRGVAALLLLIAKVTLNAADLSDSPSRLIVTVLAYLWVCAAVWMASAPHQVVTGSTLLRRMPPVAEPPVRWAPRSVCSWCYWDCSCTE